MSHIFPKSANKLPLQIIIFVLILVGIVTAATTYYATPKYTRIGYAPVQPVPFSHALHNGQLGIDCRYCHIGVDQGATSTVPTAQTCMNCHSVIRTDSAALAPVRESYASGDPIKWVKIHQVPDYVYFNHAVHVNRGISCVECHGQINEMDVVTHSKPLSMGFCLDCHRAPASAVRPLDQVTNLNWTPANADEHAKWAADFVKNNKISPPQSCTGCHR